MCYITNKAKVLFSLYSAQKTRVYTRKTNSLAALVQKNTNNILVELTSQNHLNNFHGFSVGVAESINELAFLSNALKHMINFRAAAVNKYNLNSDCAQKNNVIHYGFFKLFVKHCVATVLYYDNLAAPLFKIRQRLNQYF